jgi:replicative DNA helicase
VNYAAPDYQPYIALAQEIMRRAYAEEDATELNRWLASQVAGMGGMTQDSNAVLTWEESFTYTAQMLEKLERDAMLPPDQRAALDWPWDSWNDKIDAFEPGMLFTLFAGDGMGKTIVAECCAEHWARRNKRAVFLHYELNKSLMMLRRLARHTGLTVKELKGAKTPAQRQMLAKAEPLLRKWDGAITYVHCPGWSAAQTVQKLNALKNEGLCDVVITDYIEKIAADRRQMQLFGGSLNNREADNVEQLKNFAEVTETPVLMLAQGSKEGKSKKHVEDMDRNDMRGAGEKSERANLVVKLHRERVPEGEWEDGKQIINPNGYSRHITILVDKQTVGPTGSFQQFMEPHFFRMHDVTRQELNP